MREDGFWLACYELLVWDDSIDCEARTLGLDARLRSAMKKKNRTGRKRFQPPPRKPPPRRSRRRSIRRQSTRLKDLDLRRAILPHEIHLARNLAVARLLAFLHDRPSVVPDVFQRRVAFPRPVLLVMDRDRAAVEILPVGISRLAESILSLG